jgi:Uma2 family endonuclease
MAMPLAPDRIYTVDEVQALPNDGNRYELVWGELLVTPPPRPLHQLVVERLGAALSEYCERERVGKSWHTPAEISWSDDTLVQPDVFIVARGEAATLDWRRMKTLLLVAEVLSPRTVKQDRFQKRKLYQSQGVGVVWIVDADDRSVQSWAREAAFPVLEIERLTWHPEGASAPFSITLAELFAPIEP